MVATTALCEALNQGITSGNLIDTKIVLYSHRDSSGRACRPKALYANSRVLKTVPYFNDRKSVATLDTTAQNLTLQKFSSGTLQSPNRKTSTRKKLMMKNLQKATDICPTAISRMMRTRDSPRSRTQGSPRFIHSTHSRSPDKTATCSVKSTRNASKRAKS